MGPLGSTFGQLIVSTTYDPGVVEGWGVRRNNWEVSTSVTHELMSRVSLDVAYFHRVQGNYTATDNRDIVPADHDEDRVTAPDDARLPNPGEVICTVQLKTTKFGPTFADDNYVTFADQFGPRAVTFNGVDFTVNARPTSSFFINGGISTGVDVDDDCEQIVDSPQKRFCRNSSGWITQMKASGSYTLPWQDINIGAVLQNLQGQAIGSTYNYNVSQTNLGRSFTGTTTRSVQLIEPGTLVHVAPHPGRPAVLQDLPAGRREASAGDDGPVQHVQLERASRGQLPGRRDTAPGIDTDLRAELAAAADTAGRDAESGPQFNF